MRTRKDWQRPRNAVPLRLPLPNIRIPLRPSDDDDDCYRDGRYQRTNYRVEPVPRFGEEDAAWIDQLLREKGLR